MHAKHWQWVLATGHGGLPSGVGKDAAQPPGLDLSPAAPPPPPASTGRSRGVRKRREARTRDNDTHARDAAPPPWAADLMRAYNRPAHPPKSSPSVSTGLSTGLTLATLLILSLRRAAARRARPRRAAAARASLRATPPARLADLLGGGAAGAGALPAWAAFPDWERAEFLNTALRVAWPALAGAAAEAVPPLVDDAIAQALPPWLVAVRLRRFDLGSDPPVVEGVKVYPPPPAPPGAAAPGGGAGGAGGAGDRLTLEVDVAWVAGSGQGVDLEVVPLALGGGGAGRRRPGGSGVAHRARGLRASLARALSVTAGVSGLAARARVRVEAGPLIRTLPLAAALSASLLDPPDLGFELSLAGGDLSLLPGLEAWLTGLVRDGLRPFILPGRFTYPLVDDPPPPPAPPAGVLRLVLLEAAALPRTDMFSGTDAYATAALSNAGTVAAATPTPTSTTTTTARTRVAHKTSHPVWGTAAVLVVADPAAQALEVCVLSDADTFPGGGDKVGRASLPLSHLAASPGVSHDVWLDLRPPEDGESASDGLRNAWERPASGVTGAASKAARLGCAAAAQGAGLLARPRRAAWLCGLGVRGRQGGGAWGAGRLHLQTTYFAFGPEEASPAGPLPPAPAPGAPALARPSPHYEPAPIHPPSPRRVRRPPPSTAAAAATGSAADLLGGGVLIVRPRRAVGLPPATGSLLSGCLGGAPPAWAVRVRAGPAATDETEPAPAGGEGEPAWVGDTAQVFLSRSQLDALCASPDAWAAADAAARAGRGPVAAAAAAAGPPFDAAAGCFLLDLVDVSRSKRGGGRVAARARIPAVDLVGSGAPGHVRGDLPLEPVGGGWGARPGAAHGRPGEASRGLVLGRPPVRPRATGLAVGTPFLSAEVRWVWLSGRGG